MAERGKHLNQLRALGQRERQIGLGVDELMVQSSDGGLAADRRLEFVDLAIEVAQLAQQFPAKVGGLPAIRAVGRTVSAVCHRDSVDPTRCVQIQFAWD